MYLIEERGVREREGGTVAEWKAGRKTTQEVNLLSPDVIVMFTRPPI